MTLAELKRAIENIEKQLSSIDIPVRIIGKSEANIKFNLAIDGDGNVVADMGIFGVPEIENARASIRQRIANLEVGEEVEFSLDEYKASSLYNAACAIGREMKRVYNTRSNWDERVMRVIRVE